MDSSRREEYKEALNKAHDVVLNSLKDHTKDCDLKMGKHMEAGYGESLEILAMGVFYFELSYMFEDSKNELIEHILAKGDKAAKEFNEAEGVD